MNIRFQQFYAQICAARQLIARFYAKLYGWTITIFFIAQILFVYAATHGGLSANLLEGGLEQALTASLTISVHAIVFFNTMAFMYDLLPTIVPIAKLPELSPQEKASAKDAYQAFLIGLVVATFLAGASAIVISLSWSQVIPVRYWPQILKYNELVSILIFCAFLFSDYMGYVACKIALTNERCRANKNCEKVARDMGEVKLLILAVDIPGLLGILFIALLTHCFSPSNINYHYWHGFAAGAIGLHVAFSQASLALIAARHAPDPPLG